MAGDPNRSPALASDLERENVQFPAYSPREESEPILRLVSKGRTSIAVFGELHDFAKPLSKLSSERDVGHNIATAKCILPKILRMSFFELLPLNSPVAARNSCSVALRRIREESRSER